MAGWEEKNALGSRQLGQQNSRGWKVRLWDDERTWLKKDNETSVLGSSLICIFPDDPMVSTTASMPVIPKSLFPVHVLFLNLQST